MVGFSFPLCLAFWRAGRVVWSRERIARQLAERSEQLRRQREATAALAVEIDRARLASDLDLAARSRLREMIDLASAAGADRDAVRERFLRIERLGRESLHQMRGLLGVLRSVDRGARAPRPTLEQLDALLADARAGGRVIDLEIEGEHRPLAAGVDLAADRTVQHALVAIGNARDQPATVRVRTCAGCGARGSAGGPSSSWRSHSSRPPSPSSSRAPTPSTPCAPARGSWRRGPRSWSAAPTR